MVRLLPSTGGVMPRRTGILSVSGFSLIEMMLVVCVIGILGAIASFQIGSIRPGLLGDGAMRVVMSEMNTAREMAIAQRRRMQINFVGTNRIQIERIELTAGQTTILRDVAFESGVGYQLIGGIADTPDAFGAGSATSFGATAVRFNTEGALIDTGGAPVNGTVFLAIPGQNLSYRAVTVQGSTGRVRGYKWVGNQWRRG